MRTSKHCCQCLFRIMITPGPCPPARHGVEEDALRHGLGRECGRVAPRPGVSGEVSGQTLDESPES